MSNLLEQLSLHTLPRRYGNHIPVSRHTDWVLATLIRKGSESYNGESKISSSQNIFYPFDFRIIFSGFWGGFSVDFPANFRTDVRTDFRSTFSCFGSRRPPLSSRRGGLPPPPYSLPPPKFRRNFRPNWKSGRRYLELAITKF